MVEPGLHQGCLAVEALGQVQMRTAALGLGAVELAVGSQAGRVGAGLVMGLAQGCG